MSITDYRTAEQKRTEKLLDELAEIGSKAYNKDCRDSISRWEKIGMAISHTGQYSKQCYELANTVAEDWNWHGMVAIVDFLLDKQRIAEYSVRAMQNAFSGEHVLADTKRKVRLTLTVEEVDD